MASPRTLVPVQVNELGPWGQTDMYSIPYSFSCTLRDHGKLRPPCFWSLCCGMEMRQESL